MVQLSFFFGERLLSLFLIRIFSWPQEVFQHRAPHSHPLIFHEIFHNHAESSKHGVSPLWQPPVGSRDVYNIYCIYIYDKSLWSTMNIYELLSYPPSVTIVNQNSSLHLTARIVFPFALRCALWLPGSCGQRLCSWSGGWWNMGYLGDWNRMHMDMEVSDHCIWYCIHMYIYIYICIYIYIHMYIYTHTHNTHYN